MPPLDALPDHDAPADAYTAPAPLSTPVAADTRLSPAEEARTIVAGATIGTLGTLSEDGGPWASMVAFATLADGRPVLVVSTLAEHGRNLLRDPRASLSVVAPATGGDPLDSGRVTLAGAVEPATGDDAEQAREAYVAAVPPAGLFAGFGDFRTWLLRVDRARWVGGYGRMDSVSADDYAAAAPDPVLPGAAYAVEHLNADHADALLEMARNLGGYDDADEARCLRADRYGLDLRVTTPRGVGRSRIGFDERLDAPAGLRAATVALARRARGAVLLPLLALALVAGGVGATAPTADAAPTAKVAAKKKKSYKRVVALSPFLANAVARLGITPKAVGDAIDAVPRNRRLNGVRRLTLAHPNGPNLEQLIRIKPDLVLSSPNWRTGTPRIRRQGIEVVDHLEPLRINDVSPAVRRLGRLFGRERKARTAIKRIDRGIRAARGGIVKRPKVLLVLGVGRSTIAFLPNSWGGDAISYAGGELVTAGLKASFNAGIPGSFAPLSDEEVLRRDPDVIIVVPHGNVSAIEATKQFFRNKPGWAPTRAAKSGQIHIADPNTLLQASDDPGAVITKVRREYLKN
nr:ABC transporter substrate-binding protein [Patulibacter sp. DM4]